MRALFVLCVVATLAAPALADSREDARREFAAGQEADKAGDYGGAIEHYVAAYKIKEHPFAVYNIAVDYERLHNFREAERWYQHFVEMSPPGPQRDNVEKLIPGLRLKPATLSVRTIPDRAEVTIDGRPAGLSPLSVTLPGGAHHVVVNRDGSHDEKEVSLDYGEPFDAAFTLAGGAPGQLFVFGTPAGAYIALDNITIGTVPTTIPVQAGPHTVRVTANGYAPFESGTTVEPGQIQKLEVRMQRNLGTVEDATAATRPNIIGALGFIGGADVNGGGGSYSGTLTGQWGQFGFGITAGYGSGSPSFGLLYRWFVLPTVVTPFVTAGYEWGGIGSGYFLDAGFRWDISRSKVGLSLLADIALREYTVEDMTTFSTTPKFQYPFLVTLEATFR
ncbi:MAG TPA: PEGA domain-containing protein [Kofleriaceae bacterium]